MSKASEQAEIIRIAAAQWASMLTPKDATSELISAVSPSKSGK